MEQYTVEMKNIFYHVSKKSNQKKKISIPYCTIHLLGGGFNFR